MFAKYKRLGRGEYRKWGEINSALNATQPRSRNANSNDAVYRFFCRAKLAESRIPVSDEGAKSGHVQNSEVPRMVDIICDIAKIRASRLEMGDPSYRAITRITTRHMRFFFLPESACARSITSATSGPCGTCGEIRATGVADGMKYSIYGG